MKNKVRFCIHPDDGLEKEGGGRGFRKKAREHNSRKYKNNKDKICPNLYQF